MEFHPKVHETLLKCYFYVGGYSFEYLLKIVNILPLSKRFDLDSEKEKYRLTLNKDLTAESIKDIEETAWDVKKLSHLYFTLKDYLESLPSEEIFRLLLNIFPSSDFQRMQKDYWNYYGEYVKDWAKDLIHYLSICGVNYDSEKRQFTAGGQGLSFHEAIYKADALKTEFKDQFYNKLVFEINRSYKIGAYTGAFILCRKLIENLMIDILRKKFPPSQENLNLYFRENDGRFHDFKILMENLEEKKKSFGIDEKIIDEVLPLIKKFRPDTNSKTHSIIIFGNEGDINKFQIEYITGLLQRIEKGIF